MKRCLPDPHPLAISVDYKMELALSHNVFAFQLAAILLGFGDGGDKDGG